MIRCHRCISFPPCMRSKAKDPSFQKDLHHLSRLITTRTTSKPKVKPLKKPSKSKPGSTQVQDQFHTSNQISTDLSMLMGRVLAAFGILHIVTEYGVDLTRCEGPSMMPTIRPHGEIIVIEKITHRLYGIDGGNNGKQRAMRARAKQKEWVQKEQKQFLEQKNMNKNRSGSQCQNKNKSKSKKTHDYTPTWYQRKPPQANRHNHDRLSTISQTITKFTTGVSVGDVVVLEHPDKEGTVCKRVLGLPGDLVLRPKRDSYFSSEHRNVMDIFEDDNGEAEMDGNDVYNHFHINSLSNSSLLVVPDGHLWVEGDNSINSADSRNYGPVSSALVVGKVWFRIWPLRGSAMLVRGGRPMPPKHAPFTGSTIIPAGYEGEVQISS